MWVRFMDMHSGGGPKQKPYEYLYIEAVSEEEAVNIFYNRFGHHPREVACPTCGSNYSISSDEELAQLTGYDRGCMYDNASGNYLEVPAQRRWGNQYTPLDEYIATAAQRLILFIPASEVSDEERWDSGYEPYDHWRDEEDY